MLSADRWWRAVAAMTAALVLAAACSSGDDTALGAPADTPTTTESAATTTTTESTTTTTTESTTTTTTELAATTTTTESPTTTTTESPEPLTVLLIGDSLMADTEQAAILALESASEPVDAQWRLFPAIPRSEDDETAWRTFVEDVDPDVLIVFIGTWEGLSAFVADVPPVGEPGFEESYRSAVLAPWLDHLAGLGVHTIFLGSAPMPHPVAHERIQATIDATEAEVADREGVDFVRADTVLGGTEFTEVLPDPRTGVPERIRRVADVHLCTDGVERVVDVILERMDRVADLTIGDEWRDGPWRTDAPYDPAECPPV